MTLLAKVTLNDLATLVLWLVILRKIFHSVCSYEATWVKRGWVVLNWFWAMSRLIEQDRWTKFQNQNFFKILLWYLLFLTYHTNPPVGNLCTKSKSFNGHKEKSFLRLGVNPNVHTTPIRASHRRVSSLFFFAAGRRNRRRKKVQRTSRVERFGRSKPLVEASRPLSWSISTAPAVRQRHLPGRFRCCICLTIGFQRERREIKKLTPSASGPLTSLLLSKSSRSWKKEKRDWELIFFSDFNGVK